MTYSQEVEIVYTHFLRSIEEKGIRSRVRGKRAKNIISSLLQLYSMEELLRIIDALPPGGEFELFFLLKKGEEGHLKSGYGKRALKSPPDFGSMDLEEVIRVVLDMYILPYISGGKEIIPYLDLLENLLRLSRSDKRVLFWLVADEVLQMASRLGKVSIPRDISSNLKRMRRKRSLYNKLKYYHDTAVKNNSKLKDIYDVDLVWLQEESKR